MTNDTLAVIWRPHEHADEYLVFIDDEAEYKAWKDGSKDIALARFLGNYNIYSSGTGHTGILKPISKQELETAFFGDDKKVKDKSNEAAIQLILDNGKPQTAAFKLENAVKNATRGHGDVNTGGYQGR
ncbi:hypothetical protein VHUM_03007 [Vanrija humicola]|uniref:Ribosome maturation protein SDO1/SBDS N-terminal domain-containing protein n=1 Tax=Vanrija humicola TaxID=5417 RepID=A0A7D8YYM3_VANHU|nr:hypothetical protein VHUM_03007 [Vanrija humicola]